jgi:UDP-N-acetylmuramate dehydrogenase
MSLITVQNASLRKLNSFGIDAHARCLIEVVDRADLPQALELARQSPPLLLIGGGSNLLLTGDFPGTVLHVCTKGRRIIADDGEQVIVEAQAGENWDAFVRWTLDQGLGGLENLALIPGSVGAAPVQNIGAYGVELCERFDSLQAIDMTSGLERQFSAEQCGFGYRDSVFKRAEAGRWLIVSVRLRLARHAPLRLDYADLRDELQARGCAHPSHDEVAQAVSAVRRRKLPDPAVLGNAGSFFKNPVVDASLADQIEAQEPGLVRWPDAGRSKLSAAWMIDRCGFKGLREGDAGVHASHALVLVNHGQASGAQVLALARRIQNAVKARFGVELEPEPLVV